MEVVLKEYFAGGGKGRVEFHSNKLLFYFAQKCMANYINVDGHFIILKIECCV